MKKIMLFTILLFLLIICFGCIKVLAASESDLTYTVSNGTVTITDCKTSANGELVIPAMLGGYPVTSIANAAFFECRRLESVTIPNGVTNIGDQAFEYCESFTSITIPESVTNIGDNAFESCKSLISVTIPDNVSIGDDAFRSCKSLTSVTIPDGVSIGACAFLDCSNLEGITISDSVTSIGGSAFYATAYYKNTSNWENEVLYIGNHLIKAQKSITGEYNIKKGTITIGNEAFYDCCSLTNITSPNSVTIIGERAFYYCESLKNITIPNSVTSIGKQAFYKCGRLTKVYYIGSSEDWNKIKISNNNDSLLNATKIFVPYVRLIDENGNELGVAKWELNTSVDTSWLEQKNGYTLCLYTDKECTSEFDVNTPFVNNIVLYIRYVLNQYTIRFVDEDGTVLKEEKVDHGATITPPQISDKSEYYVFECWQNYNDGITATSNLTFKAVFKYRIYSINAEGLSEPINVAYNSDFFIESQKKDDYHYFMGYFTEKGGKGKQITNEKGESLSAYNVIGDLTVYPYFYEGYMNKIEMQGTESVMLGDTITQSAIFATDKNINYFIATVKYPKHLSFKSIKGVDFKEATKDSEKVVGDFKYADITCVFDYEGNFAEINTNYVPFEIEFDVNTDATLGACEISIENVMLIGDDTFDITDIKNHTLTILPKLAENIEIFGKDEINKTTQFIAVVSPDYTTDKSVVWSVDDGTVATVSQDGTVTPVKNGTVIVTATAKDGSEVFAAKTVNVIAYAKINSLDFGCGVVLTEFNPDVRKYTVYVKEDATSISLTPTFSGGGVLRPNGSGVWVSGRSKDFELNDTVTTITLNRDNVTDMTNSIYTVEVIKFEGTKTEVSEDKKLFTITPINIENGKTVILALYNGEQFVEMQSAVYSGESVPFTTSKTYTNAKVMVWNDLTTLKPVCEVEIVR